MKKSTSIKSKPAAKKKAAKTPAKKKAASKKNQTKMSAKKVAARADFGAPVADFFTRQPATLLPILEKLRALVEKAAPDAESSLKWGMPFYSIGGTMMCALGAHKAHVNLILSGPPGTYSDPKGRLAGDGKTGRHLKLTSLEELPLAEVRTWLKTAAQVARRGGR